MENVFHGCACLSGSSIYSPTQRSSEQVREIGSVKIAYLVNCYPVVSHSFIRDEIAGIEKAGGLVERYSIRPCRDGLPDQRDRREAERTTVILAAGIWAMSIATLNAAVRDPRKFVSAVRLAIQCGAVDASRLAKNIAYLTEACWLAGKLHDVQHVHAHFGTNPAAVARLVHKLTGITYSFTVHGPDEFDSPVALDLRGKCADARFVIAISDYGRSQLLRWSYPAEWHKIRVSRCGVGEVFLGDAIEPDYAGNQICCVARLSAQKGIPILIVAVARVLHQYPDLRLVLVGDGEDRHLIEQVIAEHGVSGQVRITGFVDAATVRQVMLESRAMVLPSFAEGLPVVIMEALALRLPVIATRIAGIPELVDGECGWLATAGSEEALGLAIKQAMQASVIELRAMGEIGRIRVNEKHSSEKNSAILFKLIAS